MSLREKLLRVAPEEWENEFVRIRPMATRDDLIYAGDGCRLTDEQREFVNPVWFSLGRAYLAPEDHDPCLIENERREPIGFLCFTAWADAYSWSYFLDVRQQGRGYGKRAAQLALLTEDARRYVRLLGEIPSLGRPQCVVYSAMWCPTSEAVVCRFLRNRADRCELGRLEAVHRLFRTEYVDAADVREYRAAYEARADRTYQYAAAL